MDKKKGLGIGTALLILLGLMVVFRKPGETGSIGGASVGIKVIPNTFSGRQDRRVGLYAVSPSTIVAGGTGSVAVTITNTSKYSDGSAAPYTFTIRVTLIASGAYLVNVTQQVSVPAGGTLTIGGPGNGGGVSLQFSVPINASGTYYAGANLFTTDGQTGITGATAGANGSVTPATVTPGGSVSF